MGEYKGKDERTLLALLQSCTDFQERRKIRTALREVRFGPEFNKANSSPQLTSSISSHLLTNGVKESPSPDSHSSSTSSSSVSPDIRRSYSSRLSRSTTGDRTSSTKDPPESYRSLRARRTLSSRDHSRGSTERNSTPSEGTKEQTKDTFPAKKTNDDGNPIRVSAQVQNIEPRKHISSARAAEIASSLHRGRLRNRDQTEREGNPITRSQSTSRVPEAKPVIPVTLTRRNSVQELREKVQASLNPNEDRSKRNESSRVPRRLCREGVGRMVASWERSVSCDRNSTRTSLSSKLLNSSDTKSSHYSSSIQKSNRDVKSDSNKTHEPSEPASPATQTTPNGVVSFKTKHSELSTNPTCARPQSINVECASELKKSSASSSSINSSSSKLPSSHPCVQSLNTQRTNTSNNYQSQTQSTQSNKPTAEPEQRYTASSGQRSLPLKSHANEIPPSKDASSFTSSQNQHVPKNNSKSMSFSESSRPHRIGNSSFRNSLSSSSMSTPYDEDRISKLPERKASGKASSSVELSVRSNDVKYHKSSNGDETDKSESEREEEDLIRTEIKLQNKLNGCTDFSARREIRAVLRKVREKIAILAYDREKAKQDGKNAEKFSSLNGVSQNLNGHLLRDRFNVTQSRSTDNGVQRETKDTENHEESDYSKIKDVDTLKQLLDSTIDFHERRKIRLAMRELKRQLYEAEKERALSLADESPVDNGQDFLKSVKKTAVSEQLSGSSNCAARTNSTENCYLHNNSNNKQSDAIRESKPIKETLNKSDTDDLKERIVSNHIDSRHKPNDLTNSNTGIKAINSQNSHNLALKDQFSSSQTKNRSSHNSINSTSITPSSSNPKATSLQKSVLQTKPVTSEKHVDENDSGLNDSYIDTSLKASSSGRSTPNPNTSNVSVVEFEAAFSDLLTDLDDSRQLDSEDQDLDLIEESECSPDSDDNMASTIGEDEQTVNTSVSGGSGSKVTTLLRLDLVKDPSRNVHHNIGSPSKNISNDLELSSQNKYHVKTTSESDSPQSIPDSPQSGHNSAILNSRQSRTSESDAKSRNDSFTDAPYESTIAPISRMDSVVLADMMSENDGKMTVIKEDDGSVTMKQVSEDDSGRRIVTIKTRKQKNEEDDTEVLKETVVENEIKSPGGSKMYEKDVVKTKRKITSRGSNYYQRNTTITRRLKDTEGDEVVTHDLCVESQNKSVSKGESWGDRTVTKVTLNKDSEPISTIDEDQESAFYTEDKVPKLQTNFSLPKMNVSKCSSGYGSISGSEEEEKEETVRRKSLKPEGKFHKHALHELKNKLPNRSSVKACRANNTAKGEYIPLTEAVNKLKNFIETSNLKRMKSSKGKELSDVTTTDKDQDLYNQLPIPTKTFPKETKISVQPEDGKVIGSDTLLESDTEYVERRCSNASSSWSQAATALVCANCFKNDFVSPDKPPEKFSYVIDPSEQDKELVRSESVDIGTDEMIVDSDSDENSNEAVHPTLQMILNRSKKNQTEQTDFPYSSNNLSLADIVSLASEMRGAISPFNDTDYETGVDSEYQTDDEASVVKEDDIDLKPMFDDDQDTLFDDEDYIDGDRTGDDVHEDHCHNQCNICSYPLNMRMLPSVGWRISSPEIIIPLRDTVAACGTTAVFESKVLASPLPTITWYLNNEKLEESKYFMMRFDEMKNCATLEMKDVNNGDGGIVKCHFRNPLGDAESSCKLSVKNKSVGPPTFTTTLSDITVPEGHSVTMQCVVTDASQILWYRDGIIQRNSSDFRQTFNSNKAKLDIAEVFLDDSGEYTCIAKNELGEVKTVCHLHVEESVFESTVVPMFLTKLRNRTLKEGTPFSLEVEVIGSPQPDVWWQIDGEKIDESDTCIFSYDGRVAKLTATKPVIGDSGRYECIASNSAGKVSMDAEIKIEVGNSKPVFKKPLCNCAVFAGKSVKLVCKVSGHPKPTILWRKNDTIIGTSTNFMQSFSHGQACLEIAPTREEDSGIYECVAHNSSGEASTSCTLSVKGLVQPGSHEVPRSQKPEENVSMDTAQPKSKSNASEIPSPQPKIGNGQIGGLMSFLKTIDKAIEKDKSQQQGQNSNGESESSIHIGDVKNGTKSLQLDNSSANHERFNVSQKKIPVTDIPTVGICDNNDRTSLHNSQTDTKYSKNTIPTLNSHKPHTTSLTRTMSTGAFERRKSQDNISFVKKPEIKIGTDSDTSNKTSVYSGLLSPNTEDKFKGIVSDLEAKEQQPKKKTAAPLGRSASFVARQRALFDNQATKSKIDMSSIDQIEDEEELHKMMNATDNFEERKKIRARMKEVREKKQREWEDKKKEADKSRTDVVQERLRIGERDKQRKLEGFQEMAASKTTTQTSADGTTTTTSTSVTEESGDGKKTTTVIKKTETTSTKTVGLSKPADETCESLTQKLMNASGPGMSGKITVKTESWSSKDGQINKSQKTETWGAKKPASAMSTFKKMDTAANPPGAKPRVAALATKAVTTMKKNAVQIKQEILEFCQGNTEEYKNIAINNFSTSWASGLAFCALIHHFYPEAFDYSKLEAKNRRDNFTLAFDTAEKYADAAPLLDVEDMVIMKKPDWKCVFTYVQSLYRHLRDHANNKVAPPPES